MMRIWPLSCWSISNRGMLLLTAAVQGKTGGSGGEHAFWMTSWEGDPSKSVISSNWCTTFLPGNSGLPSRISAKMQPMLQMSMAGEYLAKKDPQSSGALYHLQQGTLPP